MLAPSTLTAIAGSASWAGPRSTAPVSALNTDPWHGQFRLPPSGATVQPWCVQIALKHAAVVSLGRATIAGLPLISTDAAPPTGTWESAATVVPGWAAGEGAAVEPLPCPFPELPLSPLPQAASATAPAVVPATATPVVRTVRRLGE